MKKFSIAILIAAGFVGMADAQQSKPMPQSQQPAPAHAPAAAAAIHPGVLYDAGLKFAQLIDAGQAATLWDNGSTLIKRTVKRDDFVATVAKARAAVGPLSARNWRAIQHQYSNGGQAQIPAGEYASVNFAIVAGGKPANEAVTFRHDEDGAWRFVGYVVQR